MKTSPIHVISMRFLCLAILITVLIALVLLNPVTSLAVVQQAPPRSVSLVARYDGGGAAHSVVVQGTYAYVGFDWNLTIVNISNPASPQFVGSINLDENVEGIALSGSYAYLANSHAGLRIVDVSTPASPSIAGEYHPPATVMMQDIALYYFYACLADAYGKLHIVSASNPQDPDGITYDNVSNPRGVAVVGEQLYVVSSGIDKRLSIISNPNTPTELGSYSATLTGPNDVVVVGSYAYVADGEGGLRVLNISNPAQIQEVGHVDTPGIAYRLAVSGDYAYVVDWWGGLRVIDISNPSLPQETGSYTTDLVAKDVFVVGEYVYVADDHGDLVILQLYEPTITPTPTRTDTPTITSTPPHTPTSTATATATPGPIYLPVSLNDYVTYFEGPWEVEPNNDYLHASGPLHFDQTYYGRPDDAKDYFSFYLPEPGKLTIDLENYTAHGAQLLLYDKAPIAGGEVERDADGIPDHLEHTGPAGMYYLYIYAAGNYNNDPYQLRAAYVPTGVAGQRSSSDDGKMLPLGRAALTVTPPIP